jgi:hypothetical protein
MNGMRRNACVLVIVAALTAGAGCAGTGGGGSAGPRQRSIDELAGSYKGVALGDPRSAAIHAFGQPVSTRDPASPIGIGFSDGGPISQKNPPGYTRRPDLLRYHDVSVLSTPAGGIHSIVISDPRAATKEGVGIGDALAKAGRVYPTLHCVKARTMSEGELAPAYCAGRITTDRYIWFGNDPIRVIALSPTAMG